jgi:hypothetical protein
MKVRTDIRSGGGPTIFAVDEEESGKDSTQSDEQDFRPW